MFVYLHSGVQIIQSLLATRPFAVLFRQPLLILPINNTRGKADVVVNFASLRSAEEATLDILKHPQYGGHIYFVEVQAIVKVF